MQNAVTGTFHLYFGDASRHPIVRNYLRSLPDFPQEIVLRNAPISRLKRVLRLAREVIKIRHHQDWALQCHDVVSGVVGVLFWKGRVIYDSHEIYSSFARRKLSVMFVAMLERFVIRHSGTVIFPSVYRSEYYDLSNCDVRIIENLYLPYESDEPAVSPVAEASFGERNLGRRIQFVYTGLFSPARAIDKIVEAFKSQQLAGSKLTLVGSSSGYLDSILADAPNNVEYLGEFSHAEVSELLKSADAGFALYKPINENNRRCAPTKLFEFLYFGLQVIASRSPYILAVHNRNTDANIIMIDEINTQAILGACETIVRRNELAHEDVGESVCWASQMSDVKALYS